MLSEAVLSHWFQGFLLHKFYLTQSGFISVIQAILARPLEPCPNQTHLSEEVPRGVYDYKNYEVPVVKKITT